jgi:hypothetical protein
VAKILIYYFNKFSNLWLSVEHDTFGDVKIIDAIKTFVK